MVTIFKYVNRKLYIPKGQATAAGCVRLEDIADLVRSGQQVQVLDKSRDKLGAPLTSTGQDITLEVLKQVLLTLDVKNDTIIDLIKRHKGVENAI